MNESNRPTITIKLKPYLQEYVRSELRDTLIASKRNVVGKILRPFLVVRPVEVPPDFPSGPEYITFPLPNYEDLNVRSNLYVTPENQKIIEEFLDLHFKDLFYHYMQDKVRFYRSFKKCILQFCSDHGFTFDYINYEMLKKYYYRRRAEEKEPEETSLRGKKMLSGNVPGKSPNRHRQIHDPSLKYSCVFLI